MQVINHTSSDVMIGGQKLSPKSSMSVHESFIDVPTLSTEYSVEKGEGIVHIYNKVAANEVVDTQVEPVASSDEKRYFWPDSVITSTGQLGRSPKIKKEIKDLIARYGDVFVTREEAETDHPYSGITELPLGGE